jgi:hypothetical protein
MGVNQHISEATIPTTIATATVAQGVSSSLKNTKSLFNSSIDQIMSGDFVWYGSDVNTIIVSIVLVANVTVAYRRWAKDKKIKQCTG